MPKYAAFLRAINVGGHVVKMDALRAIFSGCGVTGVETFIASGNVIFSSPAKDPKVLERTLESALRNALGYPVSTFVRTPEELAKIAAHMPCSVDPGQAGAAIHIIFLAEPLDSAARRELAALSAPGDELSSKGREVYWCRFGKLSESPLFGKSLGRALAAGTMRNRNTVVRLLARLESATPAAAAKKPRTRKESS
jgi:uncharacterized protein (DUF1697 family)